MGQDINVDFGLLGQPHNYVGDYVNAFKVGRDLARQSAVDSAASQYATNPQGAVNALASAGDFTGAAQANSLYQGGQDRQANVAASTAVANGNPGAAATALAPTGNIEAVMKLGDQQKAQVRQSVEQTGALLSAIAADPDPQSRLAKAQHIAALKPEAAKELGIDPNNVTLDNVSPQAFAGYHAYLHALDLAAMTPAERVAAGKPQVVAKDSHLLFGPDSGAPPTAPAPAAGGDATAQPAAEGAPAGVSPADRDALTRAIYTEAAGEPPAGQAAVAHVVLNRAKAGYGGAQTISDVVHAPGQFEGMTSSRAGVSQSSPGYQRAQQVADAVLAGQVPDPTNGADHFLNPTLQGQLGRNQPPWANGNGQRIGNHVFYGGQTGGNTAPYQVASNGPTPGPPSGGGASPQPALPAGYSMVDLGGGAADAHGHVSTPAELKAAGLPATTQAWTDGKGEIKDPPKGVADQIAAGGGTVDPTKATGIAFLHTLPPQEQALVRGFSEGRLPLPTGAALRNPVLAKAFADAAQYDPTFDGTSYTARNQTRTKFTSGQPAANITSANTVIDHLNTLDQKIDALGNVQAPLVGNAFNAAKNAVSQGSGNTAITNFNAAKQAVATELARTFQGSAPHETEIQGWLKQLDASQSPEQLHGVVKGIASLVASRVNELGDQYNQGMGRTQDGLTLLRPDAAATMARLGGGDGQRAAAKASFYQEAERNGMAPPEIDAAWQKYDAQRTAAVAHGQRQSPGAAGSSNVRHYNPQTGRLE